MRILDIRFQNLNSLAGEWQIDFTHPDYVSSGIFAITGPTGSGKTTILDAISLGLYGRTPRLDKVTKTTNEIMSRQAGVCFAEVTFETQKGRFRCHWSQRRARKRPDGELQLARHEIADADTDKILENKISAVGAYVEKVTGMDFDRFTRSMLLAQGGFAAFLQASPDKRAPILEQITGTEIYSSISIKVHERSREESEKRDVLQAELQGIRILTEDEEAHLQNVLRENQSREKSVEEHLSTLRRAISWREGIAALSVEIAALEQQEADLAKRRELFEPEAVTLTKARKALTLDGGYREVVSLRRRQEEDSRALQSAGALLPEKEKAGAVARIAQDEEAGRLQETKARQASEAEVFKKVRELDARLAEKKKQVDEAVSACADLGRQIRGYQENIEKSEQDLKQSQSDLASVLDYLAKHAADEALIVNLAAVGKSFAALGETQNRHSKACRDFADAVAKKESAAAACKEMEARDEKIRREFEKKRDALTMLVNEISSLLKGRELGPWRDELDALRQRQALLLQVFERSERIDAAKIAQENLAASLNELRVQRDQLAVSVRDGADRRAHLEKDVDHLEMQVSLLGRIRDLEEDRKRLEDGKACPLCGATDHPFARGNVPELSSAEAELKKLKVELKKETASGAKLENSLAKKEADIGHAEKDMADRKAALEADEKQCAEWLQTLGIAAEPDGRALIVREAQAQAQTLMAEISGIVTAAEDKSKKERTDRAELDKMRVKVEASGKALQDARYKLETAEGNSARLAGEQDAARAELEKNHAAALKDVAPFGIGEIPPDALDTILKDLTGRKQAWEAKQNEKAAREKKIGELQRAIEKNQALRESLEKNWVGKSRERDDLAAAYDALLSSRRDLFEDKNPDAEEKRLNDAVRQGEEALEKKRETLGRMETEIGALKERIDVLKNQVEKRGGELSASDRTFREAMIKTGFENEADYLSACLSAESFKALEDREKSLATEKTQLDARKKDKTEALAARRAENLTDQPMEALKENVEADELQLKQIRLEIGAGTKSLADNREHQERQKERLKDIEAQQKECQRWENLKDLIGSADGKKFRNFAQGLTFEMMTAHANRQLQKMTDRYLLVRDVSEPLELNVIDNYQAGEVRSTKNLSGGESFIVSLALALGLSRMASRNVRVDSLFLDEGFGTLDDDALETALDTLAELQQDGKLIGVISHVPALKERIGTQIAVIPETGGRSSLSGPGCVRT